MATIYDVVVIGGGPAGALFSRKMANWGYHVLVLEAEEKIKRKVCGEYLCPSGVDILIQEGLKERVVDKFLPIKGMKIVPSNFNFVHSEFPENKRGIAVNRELLDRELADIAIESGVEYQLGQRVKSFKRSVVGWEVQTYANKSFFTRLLIGADGRNSFTAKELGLRGKLDTSKVALHCHIFNNSENSRLGEMHLFEDGSYIGIDPTGEREVNVSLVCDAKIIRSNKGLNYIFNSYIQKSPELMKSFGELPRDLHINVATPITNKMGKISGKDFALIGDAAGFLDPLTGEGMFNGLWMARCLANEIQHSKEVSLFNFENALVNYAHKKNAFFRQKTVLNIIFQFIIKKPFITKIIAKYLNKSQKRANVFLGIIGNVYRPIDGILKLLTAV